MRSHRREENPISAPSNPAASEFAASVPAVSVPAASESAASVPATSESATASAPDISLPAITARLRAAGCVWAEDEAQELVDAAGDPADLAAMVDERVSGLPLEHVLGWVEFCGLRLAVEPGVFVPRPRTELLVHEATNLVGAARSVTPGLHPVVVDLCCGSGALGAALAAAAGPVELHAADIDPVAVRCARRNVVPSGGQVYEGDLFVALPGSLRGRVEVLLANVPYVPTEAIALLPQEARLHEPLVSLDGGADGLDVLRRVVAQAPGWLAPGGHLLVETSAGQTEQTVATIEAGGLTARTAYDEELDATVVIGTRAPV